jgi:hypothetical protein
MTHHAQKNTAQEAIQAIKDTLHTMNSTRKKSKALPVTGLGGLWEREISRIPHCVDNRFIDGG